MNSIVILEKVVILMFSFGTDSLQAQWEQVSLHYFYQIIIDWNTIPAQIGK